jgi:hypothetical protein
MSHDQGIKSKNVNTSSPYRLGAGARKQVVAGIAQLGQAQGSHVNTVEGGGKDTGYHGVPRDAGPFPMNSVGADRFGNEWATNVKCGVGGGARIYNAGTQSQHGAPVRYGDKVK